MSTRLNVLLVQAGKAPSRRKADELIQSGRVRINDQVATIGARVDAQQDVVTVGGERIDTAERDLILIALHKPRGYTTTANDKHAEHTVYELLPAAFKKSVHNIGRLDKESSGLLLFTNDGNITQRLTHPSFEHEKEYNVIVRGQIKESDIKKIQRQKSVAEATTVPHLEVIDYNKKRNTTALKIVLKEGKNRQIRRMLEEAGFPVLKLHRTRVQQLHIGNLEEGAWKSVTESDIF